MNANKLRSAEYSLPLDDDVICMDIHTVSQPLSESDKEYLKTLQSKKKKKQKEIGETKCVYYICAASKSTIYVWCFDPIQQHKESESSLQPVVEVTISDGHNFKNDELDHSLSWIRHCQFMNATQLMILRGSQSIAVQKQITFKNDEHFAGKVVLENVSASFDTKAADIVSKNQYEQEQSVQVDEDLTVLHVADVTRANPKLYDQQGVTDKKRKRMDDEDTKSSDEPMVKKQRTEAASQSVTFQDKLYEIERKTEEDKNLAAVRIPNADSLYNMLSQSLNANVCFLFDVLLSKLY